MSRRYNHFRGSHSHFRGTSDRITYSEKKRRKNHREAILQAMEEERNKAFGTPAGSSRPYHDHRRSNERGRSFRRSPSETIHRDRFDYRPDFRNRGFCGRHEGMYDPNRSRSRSPIHDRRFESRYYSNGREEHFSRRGNHSPRPFRRSRSMSFEGRSNFSESQYNQEDFHNLRYSRERFENDSLRHEPEYRSSEKPNLEKLRSPSPYRNERRSSSRHFQEDTTSTENLLSLSEPYFENNSPQKPTFYDSRHFQEDRTSNENPPSHFENSLPQNPTFYDNKNGYFRDSKDFPESRISNESLSSFSDTHFSNLDTSKRFQESEISPGSLPSFSDSHLQESSLSSFSPNQSNYLHDRHLTERISPSSLSSFSDCHYRKKNRRQLKKENDSENKMSPTSLPSFYNSPYPDLEAPSPPRLSSPIQISYMQENKREPDFKMSPDSLPSFSDAPHSNFNINVSYQQPNFHNDGFSDMKSDFFVSHPGPSCLNFDNEYGNSYMDVKKEDNERNIDFDDGRNSNEDNLDMTMPFKVENPFDTLHLDPEDAEDLEDGNKEVEEGNKELEESNEEEVEDKSVTEETAKEIHNKPIDKYLDRFQRRRLKRRAEVGEMLDTHGDETYRNPENFRFVERGITNRQRWDLKKMSRQYFKHNAEDCDNPIAIPIVLNRFPVKKITGTLAALIKQYLISKIEEEHNQKPKFSSIKLTFGVLMIYCNNQYTCNWLRNVIFSCPPIGKHTLRITNISEVSMLKVMVVVPGRFLPMTEFLACLASQNLNVQTKRWRVVKIKRITRTRTKYEIEMSEKCWNEIVMRNERLFYSRFELQFQLLKKKEKGQRTVLKSR